VRVCVYVCVYVCVCLSCVCHALGVVVLFFYYS
jgi:hypothetical protein